MAEPESISRWLKRHRASQSLTQVELAQLIGCAVVTLRKIEAGQVRPSKELATRLIETLGVMPDDQPRWIAFVRGKLRAHSHNLPTPLTTLLGRDPQVMAVCALLRGSTRLLTLAGPGGIGKTRLAIAIATTLEHDFADGVFFVDLAPIRDHDLILPTIANTLGIREQPSQALLHLLTDALRGKQIAILLDNFEQLLPGAPQIAALLSAVPGLTVLVTSRVILNLSGEYVFTVPPLGLPNTDLVEITNTALADLLVQSPAVALFMARAQAISAGFALTAANAPIVAAICRRLDGLPLAIELAAARSRLFKPAALLQHLEQRLNLLTQGAQDLPARQHTLRATLDWSYNLLGVAERALLRRLAVFTGGCTLKAIEAIIGSEDNTSVNVASRPSAAFQKTQFELLAALLDHSLISQHEDMNGELRFGMLETIHEYALEQLAASGELPVLQARHSAYYLAFAEVAEMQLEGAEQTAAARRLDAEHENLRAVFSWNLSLAGDPERALQLAVALGRFWVLRRFFREGREWLAAALAAAPQSTAMHAWALEHFGWVARHQGDMVEAMQHFEASLKLFRALGNHRGIVYALRGQGGIAFNHGHYAEAKVFMSESLALARALGDASRTAWALLDLAQVSYCELDFSAAQRMLTESLALFRTLNMPHGAGWALSCMAEIAKNLQDYSHAVTLIAESQAFFQQIDDTYSIALTMYMQAEIAQAQGDNDQTLIYCAESRSLLRDQEDKTPVARVLLTQGLVEELRGNTQAARACYDESYQLYSQVNNQIGKAQVILRLSAVATIEGDDLTAHTLLEDYIALLHDLKYSRPSALGTCLRDAALAPLDERRSIALLERDLAQFRVAGDQWGMCFALRVLGQVLVGAGAYTQAQECAHAGLMLAETLGDQVGMLIQLVGLATIALLSDQIAQAAQLCGAIEALQATLGSGYVAASMWPPDRTRYAHVRTQVAARLSDAALASAWAAGSAYSTAASVAMALAFVAERQAALSPDICASEQEAAQANTDQIVRDHLPQTFITRLH